MSTDQSTVLQANRREPDGSRGARRLRREGYVPGVVYGGGEDPIPFQVGARDLRNALAHAGAIIELSLDSESTTPVVLKERVRHPVNGNVTHIDLLRVDLRKPIQTEVPLELTGVDECVGIVNGGILEHAVREITIEALPGTIPEFVEHDISKLDVGEHTTIGDITPPAGVSLVAEPDTVVATIHAPRLRDSGQSGAEAAEIETETEVVGDADEHPAES
jgi:large subunit ribosomal protein L25